MTICMYLNMPLLAADDLSVQQQQGLFEEQKKEPVPEPLLQSVTTQQFMAEIGQRDPPGPQAVPVPAQQIQLHQGGQGRGTSRLKRRLILEAFNRETLHASGGCCRRSTHQAHGGVARATPQIN